jgi:O-antigen/teichoic acid export membrane protein
LNVREDLREFPGNPAAPRARDPSIEIALDLRRVARGGALNLFGIVATGVLQLLLAILVTHLGVREAGVFFESVAIFMILVNVVELGADTGLVRMIPYALHGERRGDVRRLIEVALIPVAIVGVLIAVATYVWAPQLSAVFFHGVGLGDIVRFLRILVPVIPLAAATVVLLAATRGFGTMAPFVLVQNVGLPAARPVLVALGWLIGLGTLAVVLGWVIPIPFGFLAALAILASMVRRMEGEVREPVPPARGRHDLAREFWRFAGPRGLAGVFGIMVTWLDVLLVGALRSTAEAGIYAAASRLALLGVLVLQAVGMAIAPHVSALIARARQGDAESLFQVATWWLIALTWPLYIALALFAPFVLQIFGAGFATGAPALTILSLAMLINLGTGNATIFLLMAGKSSWHLVNTIVSLTINVALNLMLIPRYGMTGAAIAWAASITVVNLAALFQVWRLLGVQPFGRGYPIVTLGALACFGSIGLAVRGSVGLSFASVTFALITSTVVYGFLLWRSRRELHLDSLIRAFGAGAPVDREMVP